MRSRRCGDRDGLAAKWQSNRKKEKREAG